MVKPFGGIHAVLYALFDTHEALDRGAMRAQVAQCLGAGVDGITVLGLATEVAKLSFAERCDIIRWAAADVAGAKPLSVTIAGNSVAEQVALAQVAAAEGADWLILQPPMAGSYAASEYLDFFARVAASTRLPVAIQNAPAYLGRGLSNADMVALNLACPNITLMKAEDTAAGIADLVAQSTGRLTILNGRGGQELIAVLAAGADGFILAPDLVDHAVRTHALWQAGDVAAAEAAYHQSLPTIMFVMQSIEHLITYGKRLFGLRAGIAVHDRAPCLRPTADAMAQLAAHAALMGPFGKKP